MIERIARRMIFALATVAAVAFAVLAVGAAAGRWGVTHIPDEDALVFVVPVPTATLRAYDEVVVHVERNADPQRVVINEVVDTNDRRVVFTDARGKRDELTFPPTVWRLRFVFPALGPVYRMLVGIAQGAVCLVAGAGLLLWSERGRREQTPTTTAAI